MAATTTAVARVVAEKMTTDADGDAVADRLARLQARRSPKNASSLPPAEPVATTTDATTTDATTTDAPAAGHGSVSAQPTSTRPIAARPARRRHAANGARIATAGLAATTLLGMVGVYGATRPAESETPAPAVEPTTSAAAPGSVPLVRIPIDLAALAPAAAEAVAGEPAPPAPPAPATAVPVTEAASAAPEPAASADASTHASR